MLGQPCMIIIFNFNRFQERKRFFIVLFKYVQKFPSQMQSYCDNICCLNEYIYSINHPLFIDCLNEKE